MLAGGRERKMETLDCVVNTEMIGYSRRQFLAAGGSLLAAPARKAPVIDCHVHVGHASGLTAPWTTIADAEATLRRMDEAGVEKACVFPISQEPDTYEKANQEVADIVRRHPARFIGFAKHNPDLEKGRIRQMMLHEIRDLGLRGLKLHGHPGPEILDVCAEFGLPIVYHPGRVALYDEIAGAYPAVDFILTHLGSDLSADYREHLAGIEMAKKYPNVYLEAGATVLTRYLEKAVQELPAEKIVLGSDEPEVDVRLEVFKIRVLKLPKEKEELILGGNIQRLLSRFKGGAA